MLIGVAVIGADSCKKGTSTPPPAQFSLINASPDAEGIDFLLDGTTVVSGLGYGTDTGYFVASPGIHDLEFRKTGAVADIINVNFSLTAARTYNIFAIGRIDSLKAVALADNAPTPPQDSIEVRLLNFYIHSPILTIQLAGSTDTLTYYSRTFNDQSTDTARGSFYRTIQDIYTLRILQDSTLIDTIPGLTLTEGKIYTFYLKGIYGDTSSSRRLGVGEIEHQ